MKKEKKKSVLTRIIPYAGKRKYMLFLAMAFSALSGILLLMPMWYIHNIIKNVILNGNVNYTMIRENIAYAVIFPCVGLGLYVLAGIFSHLFAFEVEENIIKISVKKLLDKPLGYFMNKESGKLRGIIINGAGETHNVLAHQLPDIASTFVSPVVILVFLFLFDWRLGLTSLIPVFIGLIFMANLVSQGDIQLLKSGLTELGTSVLPILTSSSLKTEKNYTVIILEKLASLAIQVGKDIVSVIRLRNFYIKKVEEQTEFVGVLATRDSAIIHFTEELHGVSNQARTSLIRCVLQYINLKIYDNIKVTELAKQFYLSESALRSRFKEEIGVPINEYVNKRKIEESKMMIWSGIPAGEIARRLSFYDLSHYYRTFKKYTGVTPQQFRDTNIIGQEM